MRSARPVYDHHRVLIGSELPHDPVREAVRPRGRGPYLNSGLRLRSTSFPGVYRSITYGPVAGKVWRPPGIRARRGNRERERQRQRVQEVGIRALRWKVTVLASLSVMIPPDRSQGFGERDAACAPTIPEK